VRPEATVPLDTPTDMSADALRAEVASIQWHHSIDLGHGIVTLGGDDSAKKLARLGLPSSLDG